VKQKFETNLNTKRRAIVAEPLPQSEHLILLVGGNPLPNAVAGMLLARSDATVSLVQSAPTRHSPGTGEIAQRLGTWLKNRRPELNVRYKEVDESDPASIWSAMRDQLRDVNRVPVGLNYTGGTKAMAVHSYRAALAHWAQIHAITEPVCSYLDARTLRMVLHNAEPHSSADVRRVYVGSEVPLCLEKDLLPLHGGWELKRPLQFDPLLTQTARALIKVHADTRRLAVWKNWKAKVLTPSKGNRKKKIPKQPMPLPDEKELEPVANAIRADLPLDASSRIPENALESVGVDIFSWLDGLWLESALFDSAQQVRESCQLHEIGRNARPVLEEDESDSDEDGFEFDVTAMRGHQLFGFSCSIQDKKGKLKLKLFECLIRTKQLAGDEARAALICTSERPDLLEADVHRDIDPEGRTRVFGREHLADLPGHLEAWLSTQWGEE
jgi:hypothetical protein